MPNHNIEPMINIIKNRPQLLVITETSVKYLLDYFASMVQFPRNRNRPHVLIKGEGGTGKSGFITFIEKDIIGEIYCVEIDFDDLMNHFNAIALNKLFVVITEMKRGQGYAHADKFKPLTSDRKIIVTKKHRDSIKANNYASYAGMTNNRNTLKIPEDDRIHFLLNCSSKHKNDKAYFDALFEHFKDPQASLHFYHYLMQRDVSKWDHTKIPETEYWPLSSNWPMKNAYTEVVRSNRDMATELVSKALACAA